jgi:hypothetical protein
MQHHNRNNIIPAFNYSIYIYIKDKELTLNLALVALIINKFYSLSKDIVIML